MQISVKVATGAKREAVKELPNGRLNIAVKEKPQLGAANKRVIELTALHFHVPTKKVHIVKGHHSPSKILSVG